MSNIKLVQLKQIKTKYDISNVQTSNGNEKM